MFGRVPARRLQMCLQGGFYLFVLLDWYAASWSILVLAVLEVVLVGWVYGADKFMLDIAGMGIRSGQVARGYWVSCWRFTTPLLLLTVLIATLVRYSPAR